LNTLTEKNTKRRKTSFNRQNFKNNLNLIEKDKMMLTKVTTIIKDFDRIDKFEANN